MIRDISRLVDGEMTLAQLEQQSRDAVIAYLQDSSVRLEIKHKADGLDWSSKDNYSRFFLDDWYYRIAQPRPWYRVALIKGNVTVNADNEAQEAYFQSGDQFIKWLTDREYYEN